MKKFTTEEITDLYGQVTMGKISFSRMAKVINQRMNETSEPQYKDGDFVVNVCGVVIIFKNKDGSCIYDHAYFSELAGVISFSNFPTLSPIERYATEEEKQKMLDALTKRGKRWNEEKKCIEDIPVRKFKIGDKVRIKHGVSSKTHCNISPGFIKDMDDLIGKTMTVDSYTDWNSYVDCEEIHWSFPEEWLEPYVEELKKGDLAIFWDDDRKIAVIKSYDRSIRIKEEYFRHKDQNGFKWRNAIKFESKEQYERLIKGEI